MGILDIFKRKKKSTGLSIRPGVRPPGAQPAPLGQQTAMQSAYPRTPAVPGNARAEMDLMRSQMDNLRIQYEAINARLQNIERLVAEIRSFCK